MAAQLLDYDGTWFRGMDSSRDPGQIGQGYYWNGLNVINQGGVISCRPGYRCIITLPSGNLQGAFLFRPKIGLEEMVVFIDGRAFAAPYPFVDFHQLVNIQFSPHAKQIYGIMTEQSAQRLDETLESAIELISPRAIIIFQDGGDTAPAYYDGTTADHIRNRPFETPTGGPMAWVGDRLWIANGSFVRASDIANPFSFREQVYLGGASAFSFVSDVTAMAITPSLEFPQLLVFTEENCSILQANIRTRDEWLLTPDFQREIFKVGTTSQRSIVSHFGELAWFSQGGIAFFDAAALSKQTGRLPLRDSEMSVSKSTLWEDLSMVAGAAFGPYVLMSVPAQDIYNQATWVLNNASLETLTDASGPSWCGVWTGTRPVQWVYGNIAGAERIYYVSKDFSGENRLWEAFIPDRLDNGCDITWAAELRGHFGQTSQAQKVVGADCFFRYAQAALTAIEEGLDIGIYFAGSMRGAYKQIANRFISAARGSLKYDTEITMTDEMFAFKAQSRKVMTIDVNDATNPRDTGSCPVEQEDNEDIDESFQLMIVGHGPATMRWFRSFADPRPDFKAGNPATACGREDEVRAVRFDGYGAKADTILEAEAALNTKSVTFTSNQTHAMTVDGISAVGVGFAESFVSQAAADRVAKRIAERMAENEIMGQLPKILSAGEGTNE